MARRRGAREGSVYQRARDGKWCAVVDLGFVDGKRRRKTRTAPTRARAIELLRELQREVESGATEVDPRTTVEAWCQLWLTDDVGYRVSTGQLRPATAESYERLVRCHIIPHFGHVKLASLNARTLQRGYLAMLEGTLAPSSVDKVHNVLRCSLDVAVRDGLLAANPCDRVRPPAVPRTEVVPLSLEQVEDILTATRGTQDHALWAVMAFCGLRLGEALGLRWNDLDLEAATLRVERTLSQSVHGLRFGPPKSEKARRTVPLVERIIEILRDHRILVNKRRLAASRWDENCDAVFPSQVGTWQFAVNVQRRFRELRDSLGLPHTVRPHTLRHTYASLLFDSGVELPIVQELLGHADLTTTRSIYVHLTHKIKRDAADRLQQRLQRPS